MRVHNGLKEIQLQGCVLTIGNFDGLHLGHRALTQQVKKSAQKCKKPSVVMTFDPHPSRVLRPDSPTPQLFSKNDLIAQLKSLGVDHLVIEPFTLEYSQTSARHFVQKVWEALRFEVLWVGHDFMFGKDRSGQWATLEEMSAELRFSTQKLSPVLIDGEVVSSSLIRRLIQEGNMERTQLMLGRQYSIEGIVVHGEGRGKTLGLHTANIQVTTGLIPQKGVYVTRLFVGDKSYGSVSNVGNKPTFHESYQLTVECHILDAPKDIDLYQQQVRLEFHQRLRDELKFPSGHELMKQVQEDILQAKRYFQK